MNIHSLQKKQEESARGKDVSQTMVLSAVLHMIAFIPLLAAIALIAPQALAALPPLLVTCACLAYGRLLAFVAGKRGTEEAAWMAECLPFAAFACLQGTSLAIETCLVLLISMAAIATGLVSLESLLFPRYRGFALVLGFCIVLTGLALYLTAMMTPDSVNPGRQLALPAMAGTAGLLLAFLTCYAASRRRR